MQGGPLYAVPIFSDRVFLLSIALGIHLFAYGEFCLHLILVTVDFYFVFHRMTTNCISLTGDFAEYGFECAPNFSDGILLSIVLGCLN